MSVASPGLEPLSFRKALGNFASGITVITSSLDDEPVGFTCQSFYSVSITPPLVSFSVMSRSASYPKIRKAGRFAVNILSDEQVHDFQPVCAERRGQISRCSLAAFATGQSDHWRQPALARLRDTRR